MTLYSMRYSKTMTTTYCSHVRLWFITLTMPRDHSRPRGTNGKRWRSNSTPWLPQCVSA